jgi:lipid-binding SYLF domain-containing protein
MYKLQAVFVIGCACAAAAPVAPVVGCATAPKTAPEQSSLEARAQATVSEMQNRSAELGNTLSQAAGYAVFPDIGKAGAGVGGGFGRGVLFQNGQPAGFVKLEQASLGAQFGAETFAELLVLPTPQMVDQLKRGELTLGADAGAIALTAGVVAHAQLTNGMHAFLLPRGGAMAELTISGQRVEFAPNG